MDGRAPTGSVAVIYEPLKRWWSLVEGYMNRSLTQAQDILVAISAIAKQFHAWIGTDYLAGLWIQALRLQLLWHAQVPDDGPMPRRREAYCAPNWSWASFKAKVVLHWLGGDDAEFEQVIYTVQILQYHVQPVSDDIYEQLSAGHLNCEGWLRSLRCFGLCKRGASYYWLGLQGEAVGDISFDVPGHYKNDELYYMPVAEDGRGMYHGFMLMPATNQEECRRVGCFNTRLQGEESEFLFKPPTYTSTTKETAKVEIMRRQVTFTEYVLIIRASRSTSSEAAPEQAQGSAESSRGAKETAEREIKGSVTDGGVQTLAQGTGIGDEVSNFVIQEVDSEGRAPLEEISSQREDKVYKGYSYHVMYPFEDEEAWTQGVFRLV